MPYKLRKKGSQVCVVKSDTGEEMHCHGSRAQAVNQLRALYANEKKELSKEAIDSIADIYLEGDDLKELGDLEEQIKAVWSTASQNDLPDSSFLFIEGSGDNKVRHLPIKNKDGKLDAAHLRNAIARANQIKLKDGSTISSAKAEELKAKARKLLAGLNKSVLDKAIDALRDLVWPEEDEPAAQGHPAVTAESKEVTPESPAFSVFKSADDVWHWQGVYSNNIQDRDNPPDTISAAAHKAFAELVEQGLVDKPVLLAWHFDDAPVGQTERIWYDDAVGLSYAEGTFFSGKEATAEAWSQRTDLGMSHRMPLTHINRNKENPSIIENYISTELSVLPRWAAANEVTAFTVSKETNMARKPSDEERKFLKESKGWTDEQIDTFVKKELEVTEKEAEVKEEKIEASPTPDPEPVKEKAVETEAETVSAEMKEIIEAVKAMPEVLKALSDQIKTLSDNQASQAVLIANLTKSDEAKVKDKLEGTPVASRASMKEMLLAAIGGTDAAKIDGRTVLAKDAPQQTDASNTDFFTALVNKADWTKTLPITKNS